MLPLYFIIEIIRYFWEMKKRLTSEWNFKVTNRKKAVRFCTGIDSCFTVKSFWWKVWKAEVCIKHKIKLGYQKCMRVYWGLYHTPYKLLRCFGNFNSIYCTMYPWQTLHVFGGFFLSCVCMYSLVYTAQYKVTHFKVSLCLYLLTI